MGTIAISVFSVPAALGSKASIIVNPNMSHNEKWAGNESETAPGYNVCSQAWGSSSAHVSALDMSQLAGLVYEENCTNMQHMLSFIFPGRDVKLSNCTPY